MSIHWYRHRRFVLGKGLQPGPSARGFTPVLELAIPKSINRLQLNGSGSRYVHGGAALQEVVVPLLRVNKARRSDVEKVEVDILKNYMANKSFSRGIETLGAEASLAFVVNTRHNLPYILRHSDLFEELPEAYYDSAFLDRVHSRLLRKCMRHRHRLPDSILLKTRRYRQLWGLYLRLMLEGSNGAVVAMRNIGACPQYIPEWMQLPPLYHNKHHPNPPAIIKLFTPWSNRTWYLMESDGADLLFGLVVGLETEFGYVSLDELQRLTGPTGLHIERNRWFRPTPVRELPEYRERWGGRRPLFR